MEQLSICSFLLNGHDYHLYIYDHVKNIPAGTVIRDANEVLPAARIFQYKHRPSYAGFANLFRYKLLFERGGWWVDTDTICLKAFDFHDEYVFSTQKNLLACHGHSLTEGSGYFRILGNVACTIAVVNVFP